MAVIDVIETSHERGGTDDVNKTTYKKSWLVVTDSVYDTWYTVKASTDLDAIGDEYYVIDDDGVTVVEHDPNAVMIDIRGDQIDTDPYYWLVIGEFSTDVPEQTGDPLSRPYDIEWTQIKYKKAIYKDHNDVTIKNSAGEPFLPPREIELHHWRLVLARPEATFDPVAFDYYIDTLNDGPFFGWAAATVKLASVTGKRTRERGTYFYMVTYTFDFNSDEWKEELIDKGKNELISGALVPITASGTGQVAEKLLNGSGRLLTVGATPIYLTFDVIDRTDFDSLGIAYIT